MIGFFKIEMVLFVERSKVYVESDHHKKPSK